MNWLIKMFLTKKRIKGWIHDGIRKGAECAKNGNADKLATYAGNGEDILAFGKTVCEVVKDGEYTEAEQEKLDPYVDAAAESILGFFK